MQSTRAALRLLPAAFPHQLPRARRGPWGGSFRLLSCVSSPPAGGIVRVLQRAAQALAVPFRPWSNDTDDTSRLVVAGMVGVNHCTIRRSALGANFLCPICACRLEESLGRLGSVWGIFWDDSGACYSARLPSIPTRDCCCAGPTNRTSPAKSVRAAVRARRNAPESDCEGGSACAFVAVNVHVPGHARQPRGGAA